MRNLDGLNQFKIESHTFLVLAKWLQIYFLNRINDNTRSPAWRGQEDGAIDNMRNSNCNESKPNNFSSGLSNTARCGQCIAKADIGDGMVLSLAIRRAL